MRRRRLYKCIVLCLLCVCVWIAPEARAAPASGGTSPNPTTSPTPTDVPKDSPYDEAVTDGLKRELFTLKDGRFGLKDHITRWEISWVLWHLGGCVRLTGSCPLKDEGLDLSSDRVMAAWWVMDKGILNAIPGKPGFFEGDREITRDEAARFLNQFLIHDEKLSQKVVTIADPTGLKFSDVKPEDRYARDIALCVKLGFIDETEKNADERLVFRPADPLLRGDLVVMLFRYTKLKDKTLTTQVAQAA